MLTLRVDLLEHKRLPLGLVDRLRLVAQLEVTVLAAVLVVRVHQVIAEIQDEAGGKVAQVARLRHLRMLQHNVPRQRRLRVGGELAIETRNILVQVLPIDVLLQVAHAVQLALAQLARWFAWCFGRLLLLGFTRATHKKNKDHSYQRLC